MGKMSSELLKGGEGSRTQVIYILKSSKTQDSTKKAAVFYTHTHKAVHCPLPFDWIGVKQS